MQNYILALLPIIFPPLIVVCWHWYNTLVAHLPAQVQATVLDVTHVAVQAAEQSGAQSVIKKQMAEDIVHTALASLGFKVDQVYVDAAIEATVHALHMQLASVAVVPPVEVLTPAPSMPPVSPQMPTN